MTGTTGSALPVSGVEVTGKGRGGAPAFAWLWIAGALLASMALALLATVPALPTTADAVALWVDDASLQLTWAGEVLFFATIAWGTGAAGAFGARGTGSPLRRMTALVALSVALIAFVIVLLALGRLVYPVVDIELRRKRSSFSRVWSWAQFTSHCSPSGWWRSRCRCR